MAKVKGNTSKILHRIRADARIRNLILKNIAEGDLSVWQLAKRTKVNSTYLRNYVTYTHSAYVETFGPKTWIPACDIEKVLAFYGYSLNIVITEKQ
jgi:hypothetical protein